MYQDCKVTQIMAISKNKCIGSRNTIPWRCSADMKHFAANTKGKVCIMGRQTFESIPNPLKDRTVVVVTTNPIQAQRINLIPGHIACRDLDSALDTAQHLATQKEIMIVGGRHLYTTTVDFTDKLLMSTINIEVEGDRYFDWEIPDHVEVIPFEFNPE